MKRILDSVHGHILIDENLFSLVIDTPCFQRLRRIEQTSIRAVYPCARHDRFTHSIGVYHIGYMIVEQLKQERTSWNLEEKTFEQICKSYLVACLLHDVGHAPFSHTFEEYYGTKEELGRNLSNKLIEKIGKSTFGSDLQGKEKNAAYHEYVSAYVSVEVFSEQIRQLGGDIELVVRMITGRFYNEEKGTHQIHNCFISLLHGDVIDADRLDYACRDVWASGYHTSSIDLRRLISSLHIRKHKEDYFVCFSSNVLNEIDSMLTVKDFQVKYVITHHSVVYDQWLLVSAVQFMAKAIFGKDITEQNKEISDEDLGTKALNCLCSINSMCNVTRVGSFVFKNPSDGDFIFLMKQVPDNLYFEEWYSRQYSRFALWKSPDEFAHFLGLPIEKIASPAILEDILIAQLNKLGYANDEVLVKSVTYKPKVKMSSLCLLVHNDIIRYTDLFPEEGHLHNTEWKFYYAFVSKKDKQSHEEIEQERKNIIEYLKPHILRVFN